MPPSLHKKTASWANPKSTVHDVDHRTLDFSKSSAKIAAIDNSNLGSSRRDARKSVPQGPKSLFSQFFHSSTPKAPSASTSPMKFKFSKSSAPQAPPKKIKNLPPTLYNDPAFSPDPYSHPHFVTSQGSTWTTPPAVGHPTLKSDARRLSPPDASTSARDLDELELLQPPNTPLSPTGPNDSQPEFPASLPSGSNSSGSLASTTLPSSMELSNPPKPTDIPPTSPESQVPPPEKKQKTVSFLRRKLAPTPDPTIPSAPAPEPQKPEQHDETPNYPNTRPPLISNMSAPEMHRPDDTPTLPPRPATTPADIRPAQQGRGIRALDRIDELDETNPLGSPLHHGGPYEAIRKLLPQAPPARAVPYNVGSQYQYRHDPSHAPHKDRSHKPSRRVHPQDHPIPNIPDGIPLNLNPGQVLPRNHQPYNQRQHEPQQHAQYLQYMAGNNAHNLNHPSHYHRPQPQPHHTPKHPSISHTPKQYHHQHQQQPRPQPQHHPQQHFDPHIPPPQPSDINGHQQRQQHTSHQKSERRQSLPVDYSAAYGGIVEEEQPPPHDLRSAPAEKSQPSATSSERPHKASNGPYRPYLETRGIHYVEKQHDQRNMQRQVPQRSGSHTPYAEAGQGNLGRVMEQQRPSELDPWRGQSMPKNPGAHAAQPETIQRHRLSKLDHRSRQHAPQGSQTAGPTPYQEPLNINGEQQRPVAAENQWVREPVNMQQVPQPYPPPDQVDGPQQQQQQRRPDRDPRSAQQSISGESSAGLSNARNGGKPPQPHYIPKRLVMPTPLQQSPLLSPRSQSQLQLQSQPQPQVHFRSLSQPLPYQPQPRSTSPPLVLPPLLNPYGTLQSPRAKDIPMVPEAQQGRKLLRKRNSMNQGLPISKASEDPAVAAVSFSAGLGYIEQPSRSKSERKVKETGKAGAPKRVLSKRRNDF